MSEPVLSTRNLCKRYGPIQVVTDLNLDLFPGEIHALLGENGAGKSTVIKMISGATSVSSGEIRLDGSETRFSSVREAQERGVVALPQELTLVPSLNAGENIFMGTPVMPRMGLVNQRKLARLAKEQLSSLGQELNVKVPVEELSKVQQAMVAIARALVRNARVLILDEPTAALTDSESEQLFGVIRELKEKGVAVLYVSHRLEEVFQLCDTATVMRNGLIVWTRPTAEISANDVVEAMIGRSQDAVFPPRNPQPGDLVLHAQNLCSPALVEVSIEAKSGQVLGVAGLAGSGRTELLKAIAGVDAIDSGTITVGGKDVTRLSLGKRMSSGIVYVPEERRSEGLIIDHSIKANISVANLRSLSSLGVMSSPREGQVSRTNVEAFSIKCSSINQPVSQLSGGNQQKVVLAKYLELSPLLLLLDEPTRGIDIGTKAEIYELIRKLADQGMTVVVVSSEIPELLGLADQIVIMREGQIVGSVDPQQADEHAILRLCYGENDE